MSAVLGQREEPGRWMSVALAVTVHLVLLGLLVYGVRWQTRPAAPVEVELVRAAPVVEPPPAPAPEPKVEPKPEPRIEPKPVPPPPKPDIALKEKPKPKPKPEPKEAPQPKADPFAEQLKRETEQLAQLKAREDAERAERELAKLTAAQATTARDKAIADYQAKIRAKIRGHIVLPPDIKGNPEAVFDVVQLPSGEILDARLKKSSGHAAYDAAVERAIRKSSPLPKPAQGELFSRELLLVFRPREE